MIRNLSHTHAREGCETYLRAERTLYVGTFPVCGPGAVRCFATLRALTFVSVVALADVAGAGS
jgi:hypothetical protein